MATIPAIIVDARDAVRKLFPRPLTLDFTRLLESALRPLLASKLTLLAAKLLYGIVLDAAFLLFDAPYVAALDGLRTLRGDMGAAIDRPLLALDLPDSAPLD
jgi:hypothetical protein